MAIRFWKSFSGALVVCIGGLFLTHQACGAEVRDQAVSADSYLLGISGEISQGDYEKVVAVIKKRRLFPMSLWINSPGGNVLEAIKLGSLARKAHLGTVAVEQCKSACFLAWVGGAFRNSLTPIGIHRPVYEKQFFSGLSADDARKKYRELDQAVREYLLQMDTPQALVDEMMQTPSDRMRTIGISEVSKMIGAQPPAVYEWLLAKCDNLTKEEENHLSDIMVSIAGPGAASALRGPGNSNAVTEMLDRAEINAATKRRNSLPKGYEERLLSKSMELSICKAGAIKTEQQKLLSAL